MCWTVVDPIFIFVDPIHLVMMFRYLVLFGVPERVMLDEAFGRDNPVWKAVGALLGWVSNLTKFTIARPN